MGLLTWLFERARQASKLRAAEQRVSVLAQSEERFRSLVQKLADVIIRCSTPQAASPMPAHRSSAFWATAPRSCAANTFGAGARRRGQKVERFLTDALRKPGKSVATGFRAQHARGYWLFLDAIGNNLTDNPSVGGVLLSARDISERWMLEEQLAHQAFHDSLTKLPNRALFMDRLGHALLRGGRRARVLRSCSSISNDFKVVNDTLGHPAGDQLLTAVGERLSGACATPIPWPAWAATSSPSCCPTSSRRTTHPCWPSAGEACLQTPFTLNGQKVFVSAAIGIAVSDAQANQPEDLSRNADIAMYDAKNAQQIGLCALPAGDEPAGLAAVGARG